MKSAVITFKSSPINIGDYIQSLAASKFFDEVDYYIERENISEFSSDDSVKTIMNAWWMWSKNWPPAECICPLYVSLHISPQASNWMLNKEGVEHFKKHVPIGCRDLNTKMMLQKYGIDSYFSGCLTLTLGRQGNYITDVRNSDVIICDPYYEFSIRSLVYGSSNILSLLFCILKHFTFFKKIYANFGYKHKLYNLEYEFVKKFIKYLQLASFYRSYTTLFSEEFIENAVYYTHWILNEGESTGELLAKAEKLVKTYAKAKMVITSRIHCGLPSLGCETPVLFVTSSELKSLKQTKVGGRLGGLSDFFHIVEYDKNNKLNICDQLEDKLAAGKITLEFEFTNKDTFKNYRDQLIKKCVDFVNKK